MRIFFSSFFFFLFSFVFLSDVLSQGVLSDASRVASELSSEIMSPFCPGRTLSACPSRDAVSLRQSILLMAEEGYSKDRILIY